MTDDSSGPRLSGTGIWEMALRYGDSARAADSAAEIEALGYTAVWIPDTGGDLFGAMPTLLDSPRTLPLASEQGVVLESDPGCARQIAPKNLLPYFKLPNYVNNWRRYGFTEADVTAPGSDRLVDAIVAWGDETAIAARVQQHRDAGADP